jgi:hypothetical protein
MVMHDGGRPFAIAERQHPLDEISPAQTGENGGPAHAVAVCAMAGRTGRRQHLHMGLLRIGKLCACMGMQRQQQRKQKSLAAKPGQASMYQ